ncbi:MAG: M15 family metallopeptidase [Actinomycetota bacterium]
MELSRCRPVILAVWLSACWGAANPAGDTAPPPITPPMTLETVPAATVTSAPTAVVTPTTAAEPGTVRPEWLGTRLLPLRPDGLGEAQPTPEELVNRRFPTIDLLTVPVSDRFTYTVGRIPAEVLVRTSWSESCPVAPEELSYLTVSFWGFDGLAHAGELVVNRQFAGDLAGVFEAMFNARFPIEEMRVIRAEEIDAHPTGDGNVTTGFVCRPAVARDTGWSMHAYGLAIDINPFHNPYLKADLVVPELAAAYTDREWERPGMVAGGDVVVAAFEAIGWEWGGGWSTAKDWMHFSSNGH